MWRSRIRRWRSVIAEVFSHQVDDAAAGTRPGQAVLANEDRGMPARASLLVDDPPHCVGGAAGVPRRFRAGHAHAVPADRDADLPVVGDLRHDWQRGRATARRSSATRSRTWWPITCCRWSAGRFPACPGLASGIAQQIRNGEIKKFLVQPIDMLGFLLLSRMAHKLAYYSVAVLPFALVFFICRGYFVEGWPEWERLAELSGGAADELPAGVLPGGHAGADRLLVPGGQFAAVRLHAVQFLSVGAHVPARHAARSPGGSWSICCRSSTWRTTRRRLSGEGAARGTALGTGDRRRRGWCSSW